MNSNIDKLFSTYSKNFDFKGIFFPTLTSKLLINASHKLIKKKRKILDLGCGGGIVTACLFNYNKSSDYYLSDLSRTAVTKAKKNLKTFNGKFHFKHGDTTKPWKNYKFDLIINDISGVSSVVSKISPWFKNVPIDNSIDGTNLLRKVLNSIKIHMTDDALLVLPIISLCNVKKAKNIVKKNFKIFKEYNYEWPLPLSMIKSENILKKLKKKEIIFYKKKYGIIICNTTVIVAKK